MKTNRCIETVAKRRVPALILAWLFCAGAMAGEPRLAKHPEPDAALGQKWRWALDQARGERHWAIAYETRLSLPEGLWLYGGMRWMNGGAGRQSIAAMLEGVAPTATPRRTLRRLAVVFRYRQKRLRDVWLTSLDAPLRTDGPLFWLHRADPSASAAFLIGLRAGLDRPDMAAELVRAIGYHGGDEVARFLIETIDRSTHGETREAAVRGLAFQGGPAAGRKLIELARKEPNPEVREEAVQALGGLHTEESFRTLASLAESAPTEIRVEAIESLSDHRRPEGTRLLRKFLNNADVEDVAEAAVEALAEDPDAFDVLVQAARRNPWPEAREEAMEAVVELDADRALPVLEDIIARERDMEVAADAVEAMEELPPEIAVTALFRILDNAAEPDVHEAALEALSEFPEPRVLARLDRFAWESGDAELQEAAVSALGDIELQQAHGLLLKLAKAHPNSEVREEALDVLKDRVFN